MRKRIWLAVTAACVAAVGITAPAHADRNVQNSHRPTPSAVIYWGEGGNEASPNDAGGTDAWMSLWANQGVGDHHLSSTKFHAYGEVLTVEDRIEDGAQVVVDVRVYDTKLNLRDTDKFTCPTECKYDLGTPDGSGDIPEGWVVKFRVGTDTMPYRTGWINGSA
ncbi:hypothetical protein [Streptomyces sp. NPDC053720]|uniref:hypothetical protein n=1 Tax=Streptomyces sp. NPDC053720 TaxID=3154855 RepID=UPI00341D4F06